MADRPILFSAPMVQALLAGRKTQTRRLVKPQPVGPFAPLISFNHGRQEFAFGRENLDKSGIGPRWWRPLAQPGDLLYVRETFRLDVAYDAMKPGEVSHAAAVFYEAGGKKGDGVPGKTRVSIHMPRWASRMDLRCTAVRVERLNDCSESDAIAEGVRRIGEEYESFKDPASSWHAGPNLWTVDIPGASLNNSTAVGTYEMLWDMINAHGKKPVPWSSNPLVWVYSFELVK